MTPCRGCGYETPYAKRFTVDTESCDRCGGFSSMASVPDVYFKHPYHSEALGVDFTSKSQKASVMKEMDVSEAGDRSMSTTAWVDGTRAWRKAQFEKDRPMIRENYRRYLANAKRKQ
jgi:hypothetical protein